MSDIQTLVDMGFPKERAELALQVINNKGVEPAMEWLLAHVDEEIPSKTEISEPANEPSTAKAASPDEGTSTTTDSQASAKSLRCDDCDKLFTNQMEMEFHAAKTCHNSFSESTEEKKPLTEEEKREQLKLIEEKLKVKRAEREEKERKDALERERLRIKSGKDMTEAKKKMEEQEMAKIIEQRKREKAEEKAARERVEAQIEADKAARKARLAAEIGQPSHPPVVVQSPATSSTTATSSESSKSPKEYSHTRIQIRLQDGSTLTETFSIKEQLSAVRVFVQIKSGADLPFGLMTSFPRKVFSDDDFENTLEMLGLVPSAVIIVTKAQ